MDSRFRGNDGRGTGMTGDEGSYKMGSKIAHTCVKSITSDSHSEDPGSNPGGAA